MRIRDLTWGIFSGACLFHGLVYAQDGDGTQAQQRADKASIEQLLVDIGAGPVSAAELIGVSATSVTSVQSLKDFNVLLNPGTGGDAKAGVGLQVTPARTRWSNMSAFDYVNKPWSRFLGSVSLSYAQNKATYNDADYRQQAVALYAGYYINKGDDPIVAAHEAFSKCTGVFDVEKKKIIALQDFLKQKLEEKKNRLGLQSALTPEERSAFVAEFNSGPVFKQLAVDADNEAKACTSQAADAARSKWNAPVLSATLGTGWIRPDKGGAQSSLGQTFSIAGTLGVGTDGALNLLGRYNRNDLNIDTLGGEISRRNRSLWAARYTYRGNSESNIFAVAEVSNAKLSEPSALNTVFKYALGVDYQVIEGFWLEFRFGKSRSQNFDGNDENKALLNIKWSPTPNLPGLWKK